MQRLWTHPHIPAMIKARAVKAIVAPSAMYGAELWGCNSSRAREVEKPLASTLREVFAVPKATSSEVILRQARMRPVQVQASCARARAVLKWVTMEDLWAAELVRNGPPARAGMRRKWT